MRPGLSPLLALGPVLPAIAAAQDRDPVAVVVAVLAAEVRT